MEIRDVLLPATIQLRKYHTHMCVVYCKPEERLLLILLDHDLVDTDLHLRRTEEVYSLLYGTATVSALGFGLYVFAFRTITGILWQIY